MKRDNSISSVKDKESLYDLFKNIEDRLTHLEDATIDNRELIIKLVKQGNTIVEFLQKVEVEEIDVEPDISKLNMYEDISSKKTEKLQSVKEILDEYLTRSKDLEELEEELKKHKDMLTPGQIGES